LISKASETKSDEEVFENSIIDTADYLSKFAMIIGFITIFSWLRRFASIITRHLIRPLFQSSDRLYKTYGNKEKDNEKTWAVVTGGSDGIGLAVCKKLAREGFNICIVSRT